jgi:Na+/proline symporter
MRLELGILLMGVLATSYTALGGMSAVLWTDVVQFFILVGGGCWVGGSLIGSVPGGLTRILQIAEETDHLAGFDWSLSLTEMSAGMAMVSVFLFCIQDYGTDQVTIQRIMSVRTFAGKAKAALLNSLLDILFVGMLLFIGVGLFAYTQTHPGWLPDDMKLDQLLPYYIMTALPAGISGLVITAIFAAAMSSMDSGIHSVSTVIINDFVRPLRKHPVSDRRDLFLARFLVALLGFSATLAAFWVSSFEHILEASYVIVGSFNGPILALFMLGVLTRRAHFFGWCMGMVVGLGFVFYLMWRHEDIHFLYYFPTSFAITLVLGYLVSLTVRLPLAEAALTIWGRRRPHSE